MDAYKEKKIIVGFASNPAMAKAELSIINDVNRSAMARFLDGIEKAKLASEKRCSQAMDAQEKIFTIRFFLR